MEPVVGQLLMHEYRLNLVVLSFLISCLGSYAALQCARWMFRPDGTLDKKMTFAAAVALGGVGIWAMHFVGMLAFRLGVEVSYDIVPTLGSLLAAIAISGVALILAGGRGKFSAGGWFCGSVLAGLGVAAMHYLGMHAMRLPAVMSFDMARVGASVAIAIVAAGAALWLAFHVNNSRLRMASGVVMGLAVCSMHYVGMTAASMICTTSAPASDWVIRGSNVDVWVLMMAGGVLMYLYYLASTRLIAQLSN
jgi:NO-binding membrane sensor protein with MHYT domain